jgi:hypothetical protein
MTKIVFAMIIGIGLGAALTHSIMSRQDAAALHEDNAARSRAAAPQGMADRDPVRRGGAGVVFTPAPAVRTGLAPPGAARVAPGDLPVTGDGLSPARSVPAAPSPASLDEALARIVAGPDGDPAVRDALQSIPDRWLIEAPNEVIAALDRMDSPRRRQQYLTALVRAAVAHQPELLTQIVAHVRGISEQGSVVNGLMQGLQITEDPESLLGVAGALPGMPGQTLERMVYSQIAARDPLDALTRAEALPPGETRRIMTMQAIMQLAMREPADALAWLDTHRTGVDSNVYGSVATAVSRQNPELAARYVQSVPESARGAWITAVAAGMAASDVDAALSWLGAYRSADYYSDAVAGIAQQLGSFDPACAAQLLSDVDPGSPEGRAAVSGIAAMWAAADPEAAEAWARALPRGDVRDRALMALAPKLGERLLDDATLGLFSTQQSRDSAAGAAITTIARADPQRARQLVDAHISDPRLAQQIGGIITGGGAPGQLTTFAAPVGIAPVGAVFYGDAGAGLPQLTVNGDVASFIVTRPETER